MTTAFGTVRSRPVSPTSPAGAPDRRHRRGARRNRRKGTGRHPRAGRVYLWALGGVLATATVMAIIRWRDDAHLLAIAVIAFSLGLHGYRARRHRHQGWPPHHALRRFQRDPRTGPTGHRPGCGPRPTPR